MNRSLRLKILKSGATPFQKAVYLAIARIPRGKTMTYEQIARAIRRPNAARAVGNALNKNPFAPDVPCHRVIRSDGSVGGFARGSVQKAELLRSEGLIFDLRASRGTIQR